MNESWEIKDLGSVCHVQRGLTYSGKDTVDISDQVVLRATNIDLGTGKLIFDELKYLREDLEIKPIYSLKKNSLLICFSSGSKSHLGKIALVDDDYPNFYFGGFIGQINPSDKIDSKYLFYCLSSEAYKDYISNLTDGVNINNLKATDLKAFQIPLPPLPEQQRIVSILDRAFAAIDKAKANAQQNLQNAKELFESYLQGVFENGSENWKNKTLGELCTFTQGIQRGVKLQSETQANGQVRFLRIVDYTQGNEPPRYIDHPGDKYILNEEDVALVRYGASTGFVCHGMEGALANNLFRVIPKSFEELSNRFLAVYLKSPIFQDVIKSTMNGAAMPAISFGLIKEIPFPLPNLEEQQTIIQKLTAVQAETQKLETVYLDKINDLEELKKSVLQKAFAGELETETLETV